MGSRTLSAKLKEEGVGDKFYRVNGDVWQADHVAALNALDRRYDKEIKRFTPFKEVKRILLSRSFGGTDHQGLKFQSSDYKLSADKPF